MKICILPARGGSKRILKKNIKLFNGKPLISWPLKKICNSNLFDRVIVSTDDQNIAEISKNYGAEVPFLRPKNISDDFADTYDVMKHACVWLTENNIESELLCCVYPAAVMIEEADLKAAIEIYKTGEWEFVFSAIKSDNRMQRAFFKSKNNKLQMILPSNKSIRSQDLENIYMDAAQFYIGNTNSWNKKLNIFQTKSFPFLIPEDRVQDIDNNEDWKIAEKKFNEYLN